MGDISLRHARGAARCRAGLPRGAGAQRVRNVQPQCVAGEPQVVRQRVPVVRRNGRRGRVPGGHRRRATMRAARLSCSGRSAATGRSRTCRRLRPGAPPAEDDDAAAFASQGPRTRRRAAPACLRLAPEDNVAVALRALRAGETVALDGVTLCVDRDIAVGHKVAARAIARGRDHRQVQLPDRRGDEGDRARARTCTRTTSRAAICRRTRFRHDAAGLSSRRRPQGHPQRAGRRLPGRMRASRRARDRRVLSRADVHLIGFPGCYPNAYALAMLEKLCTHPNVGGALLVSLGCEGFNKRQLREGDRGVRPAGDARSASRTPAARARRSPPGANGSSARCRRSRRSPRRRCAWTNWSSARSAAAPTRRRD